MQLTLKHLKSAIYTIPKTYKHGDFVKCRACVEGVGWIDTSLVVIEEATCNNGKWLKSYKLTDAWAELILEEEKDSE